MSRPSAPCIAYLENGNLCGRYARYYDGQRIGMVCLEHLVDAFPGPGHKPITEFQRARMIITLRNILAALRRHRDGKSVEGGGNNLDYAIAVTEAAIDAYNEKANNATP